MLRLSLVAGRELRDSLVFCLLTAAEDFNGKGVISASFRKMHLQFLQVFTEFYVTGISKCEEICAI